jgi:hypothetical protein
MAMDIDAELEKTLGISRNDRSIGGAFGEKDEEELGQLIRGVSHENRKAFRSAVNRGVGHVEKFYAAALAAHSARVSEQPNSTATLLPGTAGPYASATVFPLLPKVSGASQANGLSFSIDMVFHGLSTADADASLGWQFVANLTKFSDDPLGGIAFDTSFDVFTSKVHPNRVPLGTYVRRRFKAPTTFTCSAIQTTGGPIAMIVGVTVYYHDTRCRGGEQYLEGIPGHDMIHHVRELMSRRRHGIAPHRMLSRGI